jgi:hypothetical protein
MFSGTASLADLRSLLFLAGRASHLLFIGIVPIVIVEFPTTPAAFLAVIRLVAVMGHGILTVLTVPKVFGHTSTLKYIARYAFK